MKFLVAVLIFINIFFKETDQYLHIFDRDEICSDAENADELTYEFDGDELGYIDFKKKEGISTLPDFADPIDFAYYEFALAEMAACKVQLERAKYGFRKPPEQMDPPQTTLYPTNEVKLGLVNTFICYVTGFYPPPVKVTWSKNNVNVTEGVSLSRYSFNSDYTFTQFSTLTTTPVAGDVYSCTVEHKALQEPQTRFWDTDVDEVNAAQPCIGPTVFCGAGLVLGILGLATGIFFLVKGYKCP
ncbi:H-2 class II histocompatibility antigen, A-U alpha chain-like [Chanos chanos]|uniref:H-2 class II histocompatibility antigen, A-U alpha chain-like n=1 Tax=Chanos chanos TaxID=29144 RepID=A0A6J2UMK0_CHACN|nr:H-2 class II histocompatibility antigen, A-U alpha chain-like [Chanos chanos]